MMMAVLLLNLVLLIGSVPGAPHDDWAMANKDAQHSNYVQDGPAPPLKRAWVAHASGESRDTRWPVVYDGTVYASSGPAVLAVGTGNGAVLWEALPPEGQGLVAPAVDDAGVYIPIPGDRVLAVDRHSGEELWRFQADNSVDRSPTIADGRLYFGSAEARTFYCVDAATGSLVWQAKLDQEPYTTPVVSNGVVVFSIRDLRSPQGFLVALDSASGIELWRAPQSSVTSSPAVLGHLVVVGSYDSTVNAYDLGPAS